MEKEQVAQSAFGALLRHHRVAAGLSQEVLAERALMSINGISALERGERRSPYRGTVELLSMALRLTPAAAAEFEAAAARPRRPRERVLSHGAASDGGGGTEPATNLPSSRTTLVGREAEIADIVGLLQDSRLVTVTGAGGVGKTRTALAVGESFFADMKTAVWFVELAPVAQGSLVPGAVAKVLNLQESPNLLETLLAYLKHKSLLLILDNCEHVIAEAAALAAALLHDCPHLRILATTREPLRIGGEQMYRLPSLAAPKPEEASGISAAAAANYAAVALFAERAKAIDHGFTLNDDTAPIVAQISWRLDGIPLAIELAAARVNALPLTALLTKLHQRLQILTSGERIALPRQQTMRALIDWSYDLLSPPEQRLFEHVSVFAGGCTLDAAAHVCSGGRVDEFGVLALLTSLVDKSLVVADLNGPEPRYRLLETFRQYAREKLETRGEAENTQRRHAVAYLQIAERLRDTWDTVSDGAWSPSAEADMENWHAALEWTLARQRDVVIGQRIAGALRICWQHFAPAQGRHWVRAAAALIDESTPSIVVAQLEYAEAFIAEVFFEFKTALAAGERALTVYQKLGDQRGIVGAQRIVGNSLVALGRTSEGEQLLSGALDVAREFGKRQIVGWLLVDVGLARSVNGDLVAARARYSEALILFRTLGAQRSAAVVALYLASAEARADNLEAAVKLALDAIAILRGLNRMHDVMNGLTETASYLVALTRYDEARACAREALDLALERNWPSAFLFSVQHLAAVDALAPQCLERESDHPARAARLLGFVNARLATLEISRDFMEQQECDEIRTGLQGQFEDLELAALLEVGAAMTENEAIEEALEILPSR